MKKGYIISFIIGAVLFGSLGSIVTAYTYSARQISYEPSDNTWNVNNVEGAINDLKTSKKPIFGEVRYNASGGPASNRK